MYRIMFVGNQNALSSSSQSKIIHARTCTKDEISVYAKVLIIKKSYIKAKRTILIMYIQPYKMFYTLPETCVGLTDEITIFVF